MTGADRIREYCVIHYVKPARERGDYTVSIRVSDVRRAMPEREIPQICGALGAEGFERENGLERISVIGPLPGSTTLFTYLIKGNLVVAT